MTHITTVVFDVGKVLFEWDLRYLYAKLIADAAEREYFVTHVVTPQWHYQHDAGRSLDDMVAERIAQFPQYAELIRAYAARIMETIPGPVAGTHDIVQELAGNAIPLFVITNFGAEFWHRFRATQPIFDHFGDILVSGVEKLVKPDPAIYALALDRFGLNPGEAIFIDDNLDNVVSARANGFAAHHFTDAASLRAELTALNLLI
ncbi:MAG: hydrolase [Sphingomonadales bacterium 17-56-6]|jgi:2-haloacid dehalogenase|nr:MAG: hydrolase [Sphingomonadales bacterium 28-55-16]OYZ89029.1 MAG: hydrolase [Sphingomonadales bacterium 17-56-6]